MSTQQEAVHYTLTTHLMFSGLSSPDKKALVGLFQIRNFAKGEVIAEQDKPVDGMYVVYSGSVRLKETKAGRRSSLGEFHRDATFGEMSLLDELIWPYQVSASEDAILLFIPGKDVRTLLPSRTDMQKIFQTQVGLVELGQRLRGMLGAARYTPEQFSTILKGIGLKKTRRGGTIFRQGDVDPRLYYIEQGAVDIVVKTLDKGRITIDRSDKGELIGEGGGLPDLGTDHRHPHSAKAATDVTVLVIKQSEVQRMLAINPALQEELMERHRVLKDKEETEIGVQSRVEGVNQRIQLADAVTEEEFLAMGGVKDVKTFPVVKQIERADVGAACLTMVTKHYGKNFTLGQIRELSNLSLEGVTPNAVITAAEVIGFRAAAYALDIKQLESMALPGIVGWEGYHYVVVHRITGKDVHVADPAEGLKKIPKDEFLTGWTRAQVAGVETADDRGVFIGLMPTESFRRLEPPKKPILHFVGYILPHSRQFGEAMLAALTINVLGLASPLFVQNIVDTVVVHKDVALLNVMLGGMVLVTVFTLMASAAQSLLLANTTRKIDMQLMAEFYRHILSLPMGFFLTRNKGEILARFGENVKIRNILTGSSITVVMNSLMIVIYLFMMLAYNGTLTALAMAFIPLYFLILLYFTPRIKAIAQESFVVGTQAESYLIESLNGIEALKATSNEYMARARWENSFVDTVNLGFRTQKLSLMSSSLYQMVSLGSTVAILWYGANQVMAGHMTIGELMGFNMLLGFVVGPILSMLDLWNQIQEIRIAVDRVSDVLSVTPEQDKLRAEAMPAVLEDCKGRIEFSKVNFSYVSNGQENAIMRDFDLVIEPGQRVAFVGPSGCGKSTIAKMILGFNIPQDGDCRIDGKDIKGLSLVSLRRNIGVVLQDSFLFSGTVAENIALGDPEPDMQAVKDAARLAGADEFIVNYPVGYQTLVGEKGIGISGGQRQRICIARSLYRKPRIMIFDEATSALDNESEARIQDNMKTILQGRTSFTIAHRLSTIIDSDMICFISDGQVQEKGTHQELTDVEFLREAKYAGRYYNMAKTQFDLPDLEL